LVAIVKVFGCRPITDGAIRSGAGVRKPARDETAGCTLVGRAAGSAMEI
jgi:hypothetical protein